MKKYIVMSVSMMCLLINFTVLSGWGVVAEAAVLPRMTPAQHGAA